MTEKTKKQHYVPQCYLNAWAMVDKPKQIYVYDKVKDSYRENAIEDVASERFFYDVNPNDVFTDEVLDFLRDRGIVWETGEKSQGIEHAFSELVEDSYSPLLKKIIEKADNATPWYISNCYFISEAEKIELSIFLAIQFLRTKAVRNTILDASDCLNQALEDMGAPSETLKQFTVDKGEAKIVHTQILLSSKELTNVTTTLANHIWILGINRTQKKLFTSDNPIVTYGHSINPYLPTNGIAAQGVEVVFPISPSIALIMFEKTYHKDLIRYERRFRII